MTIYEYRCGSCGFQKEFLQKISDAPLTSCPECGSESLNKLVTAAGFQLKGSGWYAIHRLPQWREVGAQERKRKQIQPVGSGLRGGRVPGLQYIKKYFITGLLIWIPQAITVWVTKEPMTYKARPARKVIRVRPLKGLKDAV